MCEICDPSGGEGRAGGEGALDVVGVDGKSLLQGTGWAVMHVMHPCDAANAPSSQEIHPHAPTSEWRMHAHAASGMDDTMRAIDGTTV